MYGPKCHSTGITGQGNPEYGVMLIGISPGSGEMHTGTPMSGTSGKLLDNILKYAGWDRSKCYATNMICYEERNPSFDQIMACRPRLVEEVKTLKPKLIVPMGEAVGSLFFPNRKYGTVRGCIDYYEPWNVHVLPSYNVAAILHGTSENITRDILRDMAKIARFFDAPPCPDVKFEIVRELWRAQDVLDTFASVKPEYLALDVETHLDKDLDENIPIEETVACFSISDGASTYWFPGELLSKLTWPKLNWTFHNGMFDTTALEEAIGIRLPIVHDTMYMSYALDERGGQHKLKYLARENEAAGFYEDHSSASKWKDKLSDESWLQTYNAKDAAYTARLASRLHKRMVDDDVLDVYEKLLIPGANIYRLMQQHGLHVDIERYKSLLSELVPLREQRDTELREEIASLGGNPYINLASPKQLGEFLYGKLRLPGGPSTAAPIIEALADEHPFINKLLDLRHIDKALNTYLVGAWDDIRRTRRIHPNPGLHSQVTGRVNYTPYAVNTLPRETNENPYLARIRWMFTAPNDETCILIIDYSQAEIWNAQFYSNDANMLADLKTGDFHTQSAVNVFSKPREFITAEERSSSKKVTFGQFFGIGNAKLAKDMTTEARRRGIDREYTPGHAAMMQDTWRARYVGYLKYVDDVVEEVRKTGELVTVSKRKRRFPIVLDTSFITQAINYKIQSTSHDCLLSSIIEMYWPIHALGGRVILDLHDAVAIETPKNKLKEITQCATEIMQKPRFPGMPSIPTDAKVGYSLGEQEKFKL